MLEAIDRDGRRATEPGRGRASLLILWAFTITATVGYWVYGLHPERLAGSSLALRFYPVSFQIFAQLHILVAAAVLLFMLTRRLQVAWVPAFAAVWALSFTAEHIGTGYGVPFGGYGYTGLLGIKVGGRVPFLIPVSWFLMAVPSWVLAARAFGGPRSRVPRVVMGALWLVAWDLALDPAMSFLTPYWRWEAAGPYYGMPWLNLAGWFTTGLVIMGALEAFSTRVPWIRLGTGWAAAYYVSVLAMPVGMLVAAGVWGALATTLAAMGGCAAITLVASRRTAHSWSVLAAPDAIEA